MHCETAVSPGDVLSHGSNFEVEVIVPNGRNHHPIRAEKFSRFAAPESWTRRIRTCPSHYSIRRGNLGSVHRTPGDRNPEASSKETLGLLAEGVGFEPTVRKRTTVFETAPFDHSGTPPLSILPAFLDREKGKTRQKVTKKPHQARLSVSCVYLAQPFAPCPPPTRTSHHGQAR